MIDQEVLDSEALKRTNEKFGTFLLPQAFPEGSPLHPAYGSGHATVAGACVTVLKAWFDESWVLPDPVVPNAAGTELVPYTGPDADRPPSAVSWTRWPPTSRSPAILSRILFLISIHIITLHYSTIIDSFIDSNT